MKVKCRGFEGNLISLNPTETYRYYGDRFEKPYMNWLCQ